MYKCPLIEAGCCPTFSHRGACPEFQYAKAHTDMSGLGKAIHRRKVRCSTESMARLESDDCCVEDPLRPALVVDPILQDLKADSAVA